MTEKRENILGTNIAGAKGKERGWGRACPLRHCRPQMPAFDEIVRQAERATRLMRWSSLEEVVPAHLFYSALCLADVNLMFGRRSERRQRRGLQIWHHLREPAWINGRIGTQDHARANTLRSTHACTRTLRATSRCQWSRASTRVGVGVRARFAVAPVFNSTISRLPSQEEGKCQHERNPHVRACELRCQRPDAG